ncbi:hypothetical protein RclHR1_19600003 [Rhizophagus clarus]|uniref:Uncharacterized protein n=1 Tax=Rhizophagus clarus TaxID=94130 RepID=A0A2Z6QPU3_9GLOM|nr:hypothetical protein RclHR1_19600003 [Rhizophagus clarus]
MLKGERQLIAFFERHTDMLFALRTSFDIDNISHTWSRGDPPRPNKPRSDRQQQRNRGSSSDKMSSSKRSSDQNQNKTSRKKNKSNGSTEVFNTLVDLLKKLNPIIKALLVKKKKNEPRNIDFYTQNIQEWCNFCSDVSYFKQVVTNHKVYNINNNEQKFIENEKNCKLCGILIHSLILLNSIDFKICSNCYRISSGWIESTLNTKKSIPILYLPWWDAHDRCTACDQILKFNSNNQKWCSNCIIIYIGCRYCLVTNIIFGITDQSQCKKCKRISLVNIDSKCIESLISTISNSDNHNQIVKYVNNCYKTSNSLGVYNFIRNLGYLSLKPLKDWISYLQVTNLENNDPFNLPIPIMFIPLNNSKDECHYCRKCYSLTLLFNQKYCKYCLFLYIKYIANNNLDICIRTKITKCDRHEQRNLNFYTRNIQEWCNNCSEVLYFKQVVTNHKYYNINNNEQKFIENEKNCKLCGKLIYDQILSNSIDFKMCSNCYQISSGWIKST